MLSENFTYIEEHSKNHHCLWIFCVFRAENILKCYHLSGRMNRAQNSDSETHVKKQNRTSRTEIGQNSLKYLFFETPCICHICIIFVILFHGASKRIMARTKFFYTILIHPQGQLQAELSQTSRTFSGQKCFFRKKQPFFGTNIDFSIFFFLVDYAPGHFW